MIPFALGLQMALADVLFFPPVARQQLDQRVVADLSGMLLPLFGGRT